MCHHYPGVATRISSFVPWIQEEAPGACQMEGEKSTNFVLASAAVHEQKVKKKKMKHRNNSHSETKKKSIKKK